MKKYIAIGAALLIAGSIIGCKKEDTDAGKDPGAVVKDTIDAATPDFSTDATLTSTVIPAITTAISTAVGTEGEVTVEAMDKVIHLKGTVANNDLKRSAETAAKDALMKMNAPAEVTVNNALMVK
ncbi:MAG: hypothetical protein ACR2HJ_07335 [Fimbriimonadales bacterium]